MREGDPIPLSEEERRAAKRDAALTDVVRRLSGPGARGDGACGSTWRPYAWTR
jgi:hypothetical protein